MKKLGILLFVMILFSACKDAEKPYEPPPKPDTYFYLPDGSNLSGYNTVKPKHTDGFYGIPEPTIFDFTEYLFKLEKYKSSFDIEEQPYSKFAYDFMNYYKNIIKNDSKQFDPSYMRIVSILNEDSKWEKVWVEVFASSNWWGIIKDNDDEYLYKIYNEFPYTANCIIESIIKVKI